MSVSLDASQRKRIERRRQQTRDYRLAMRLSTVLWRDDGQTESDIARLLGVCERTVRNWLRRVCIFYLGGFSQLARRQLGWTTVAWAGGPPAHSRRVPAPRDRQESTQVTDAHPAPPLPQERAGGSLHPALY
jgi:hypothetical protein